MESVTRILDALVFGLTLGGTYTLVALGLNLQYGVARILNLAYGEMMIAAAFAGLLLFTQTGVSPLLSALLLVPVAMLLGVLLYRLAFAPLVKRAPHRDALEGDTILSPSACCSCCKVGCWLCSAATTCRTPTLPARCRSARPSSQPTDSSPWSSPWCWAGRSFSS
jgi:hypothetical protein